MHDDNTPCAAMSSTLQQGCTDWGGKDSASACMWHTYLGIRSMLLLWWHLIQFVGGFFLKQLTPNGILHLDQAKLGQNLGRYTALQQLTQFRFAPALRRR